MHNSAGVGGLVIAREIRVETMSVLGVWCRTVGAGGYSLKWNGIVVVKQR
jgi:hypothetical protein